MSLLDKKDLAEFEIDGKNYSLVHNPVKAEKDKQNREAMLARTTKKLEAIQKLKRSYSAPQLQDKVSKVINKYKCKKFIQYAIQEETIQDNAVAKLTYSINKEKLSLCEKYDGFNEENLLLGISKGKLLYLNIKIYNGPERAFDSMKNQIKIRPVFHYKESRIKGHIFTCFMSYFLL